MATEQMRFPPPPLPPQPQHQHQHQHQPQHQHHQHQQLRASRKRWAGCWGGLSCFGKQKGGKRIVPASRIPDASSSANQTNGSQAAGLNNQTTVLGPSLLAPPSSPASFSNSALPSTVQSPSCFLSANSPGGPSSTMFATGPYAHETQLVSPPVFSTFTTEPSTAPLTPPPELAHLTTPSSPDVPFAQFLSSAVDIKSNGKANYIACNDLQATYSLYPGSPASSLISPVSRASNDHQSSSFAERDFPSHWDPSIPSQDNKYLNTDSGQLCGLGTDGVKLSQDSNFFCPATFAQFYLDHSSFPHSGGRLSVSRESDAYSNAASGHQNRQSKPSKQDAEEIEAYRASFGFSADEIVTTTQYVEITDGLEDSFTITPFPSNKPDEESIFNVSAEEGKKSAKVQKVLPSPHFFKADVKLESSNYTLCSASEGFEEKQQVDLSGQRAPGNALSDNDDIFSKMGSSNISRRYQLGLSSSDAEVEYRRRRSIREGKGDFAWRD